MREYFVCEFCNSVFVPNHFHLSSGEEKKRYDIHNNDPEDIRYRNFLSQMSEPLLSVLPENSQGLDFGSGPGPTLFKMLEENGHKVDLFDIFYHNDQSIFENSYDFITATEVFEHLSNPFETLKKLLTILKPGGYLGIMTKLKPKSLEDFKNWYYKNDITHICFFSEEALLFWEERMNLSCQILSDQVILFKK